MTLGLTPSFLRPASPDAALARVRANAEALASGGGVAPASLGGGLLNWVDRPAGMQPQPTYAGYPQAPSSGLFSGMKTQASKLWSWMTSWFQPNPNQPAAYPQLPTYPSPTAPVYNPYAPQAPGYQAPVAPAYPSYPQVPAAPPAYGVYPQTPAYPQQPTYPTYPQTPAYPQQPAYANPQQDPQFQQLLATREQVRQMQAQVNQALQAPRANTPAPAPQAPAQPAPNDAWAQRLKTISPAELSRLGKADKAGFFAVLRPAAEAAEKQYGVPASVILAQAALETGWGAHLAAGYNLFGHKGTGPAGTTSSRTNEVENGRTITITAKFAKYHNFFEGVEYHGKRFHNGYYDKAVTNYAKYHDPDRFARDITGIYATDPSYGSKLITLMNQYGLKK